MHELGLVIYVMDTIEKLAKEQNFTRVRSVTLDLGEVSPVVPEYFTDCWDYSHQKSDLFKDAALKINRIPAVTICNDCGKTYSTLEYKKICPYCKSDNTMLVDGNQFIIKEIEVFDD